MLGNVNFVELLDSNFVLFVLFVLFITKNPSLILNLKSKTNKTSKN
ncbi:hypothetical protein SAMN04487989_101828 [Bizionia echini]|uniref:Uncharacterized protein n=1 Tax=Bizionia echini TaxID=649333 RepID=A0A1I4ZHF6_9FLAO|nr:hypothetical protein SAMN04487989_101828 [Bizionia echini]